MSTFISTVKLLSPQVSDYRSLTERMESKKFSFLKTNLAEEKNVDDVYMVFRCTSVSMVDACSDIYKTADEIGLKCKFTIVKSKFESSDEAGLSPYWFDPS